VSDTEPAALVAVIVDHNGPDAVFGVGASIDRWNGRSWVPHRVVQMGRDPWHCTGEPRKRSDDFAIPTVGLAVRVGVPGPPERFTTKGLGKGWYRISQEANGGAVAPAIFGIVEGADPIAPLDAAGEPAISVAPVLVAPAGATVQLSPLVPPINGVSTRADVERAIAGLSETAAIERWDGQDWKPVATISLQPSPQNSMGRRAEIPALAAGDYRMVRVGPNGAHTGRFWVA
jgi:hypothetical protein